MLNDDQFREIHGKLASDGGFTVNPHSGEPVTSGISVAPRGNERKTLIVDSTPELLKAYHGENTARFRQGASLGGWRSEDSDYFDTPTVYPATPAGHSDSRQQMVRAGQEASFNLDSFTEEFNPFHPEGRRKSGRESHEIADIAGRGPGGAEFAMRQPEVQSWVNQPRGGR